MTGPRRAAPYRINLKIDAGLRGQAQAGVVRAAARAALSNQGAATPSELTVLITGDAALRRLNRDYLGHDYATDVLSFPSRETDPASGRLYLGDIAISFARVQAQARVGGHMAKAELQLLVVHGVLHLLGHDHAKRTEKARMWAAQAAILSGLKAGITGPTADEPAVS